MVLGIDLRGDVVRDVQRETPNRKGARRVPGMRHLSLELPAFPQGGGTVVYHEPDAGVRGRSGAASEAVAARTCILDSHWRLQAQFL